MNLAGVQFVRLFRTASSERFLAKEAAGVEFAVVDLHYLGNGKVTGTVVLLDQPAANETEIARLLEAVDDQLLPDVSLESGSLSFTVVKGSVVGNFVPDAQESTS